MNSEVGKMQKQVFAQEDELLAEYDLAVLLKDAVKGKYAERFKKRTNLALLIRDQAEIQSIQESIG